MGPVQEEQLYLKNHPFLFFFKFKTGAVDPVLSLVSFIS